MHVKVFGAGIAGLTVAHMLAPYAQVDIYEAKQKAGGLARTEGSGCNTREISWRVYFHFYAHLLALLREIPSRFVAGATVADHLIPYQNVTLPESGLLSLFGMKSAWQAFEMLTSSDERLDGNDRPWAEMFTGADLADIPQWLGMDRFRGSYTSVARVGVEQNVVAGHCKDNYVLDGPTSEVWIDPWVEHLQQKGVRFHFGRALEHIHMRDNNTVESVQLDNGQVLHADVFVLALPVEVIARVASVLVPQAGLLARMAFQVQLAFQMYLARPLSLGSRNGRPVQSFLLHNSPWSIIVEAKDLSWRSEFLCDGEAQWSVVICQADVAGSLFCRPFYACTEKEAQLEIIEQLTSDADFMALLHRENAHFDGQLRIVRWTTMNETFRFDPLRTTEPKFSNNAGTLALRPHTRLGTNVFLAAAYVRDTIDIFSMEAAAIAGKQVAAQMLHLPPPKLPPRPLRPLNPLRSADRWLYRHRGPHIAKVLVGVLLIVVVMILFRKSANL